VTPILLLHTGATLAMAGAIWFVQLVHYPLFRHVPPERFAEFAHDHQVRAALVVAPLMLVEAATAIPLLLWTPPVIAPWRLWLGIGLLAVIWLSTFAIQVPLHARLARGHDPGAVERLIATNWLRTAAWSARAILILTVLPFA
jgi:hypothetical protein